MRKFISTSRGLTIIEMMGAMLVSTILLSGVWQLFQGGMRSYQRGLQDVRMTQGARTLLRLVTRDVQRAMAARVPYGIRGATPQSSTLATGEGPADRLAPGRATALRADAGGSARVDGFGGFRAGARRRSIHGIERRGRLRPRRTIVWIGPKRWPSHVECC